MFRADIPPASSVTKDAKTVTVTTENVDFKDVAIVTVFTSFVSGEAVGISVRNILQISQRCNWYAGTV